MDMTAPNLGQWLLARAREHGLTREQTADMLGVPTEELRRLTPADLAELPLAKVADLARRLSLDWPAWLTPTPPPAPHETTVAGGRVRQTGSPRNRRRRQAVSFRGTTRNGSGAFFRPHAPR
jgi:hypothetical protein